MIVNADWVRGGLGVKVLNHFRIPPLASQEKDNMFIRGSFGDFLLFFISHA